MLKLAVPAALAATVLGAGLLAADSRTPARPAAQPRPTAAPVKKASATANASTKAAPVVTRAAPVAAVHAPPPPALATSTTTAVPDCEAVGEHLARITLDGFSSAKAMPAEKIQQFLTLRTADLRRRCETQHWSDDRRTCSMGLTDANDQLACADDGVATPDEIAKLPPELQCDAVGKHLAALATAPGAKFDIVAKKLAAAGKPLDLDTLGAQLAEKTRDQCSDLSWPVSMRRCIVESKTHEQSGACW